MEFRTIVNVEDYSGNTKKFMGEATIVWSMELEARERGIKSIEISVQDQEVRLARCFEDENGDEEFETIDVEIKNFGISEPIGTTIIPTELEYDGKNWTLNF
jgi:hypothetical protein